jgi:predicted phosphodiesterase
MKDIKMENGENFEHFCMRIFENPDEYGLTKEEAYQKIFGNKKRFSETETRKRIYGICDILRAIDLGLDSKFKNESKDSNDSLDKMNPGDIKILLKENQRLKKSLQNYADKNRILRAEDRESFRLTEIIDRIIETSISISENYTRLNPVPVPDKQLNHNGSEAVFHFGDLHINKIVNLPHNKYNFNIAKKRLTVYFNKVILELKSKNITKVTFALTGDNYNLSKLKDQYLTNETVRSEALFLGFDIISEFVDILIREGYDVSFVGVCGNESRFDVFEKQSNCDEIVKDSFDYMLFQQLKRRYSNICVFLNECDCLEQVITINGKNILLIHGDKISHKNLDETVDELRNKYMKNKKIYINFVILGHIHKAQISCDYARTASLVGSDEYVFNGLNISGSDISQLLHIITEYGDIMSIIINCEIK